MKEIVFIRKNIDKWKEIEKTADDPTSVSPDQMASNYTEVVADLSFAQTHYPDSKITTYLNVLASSIHNQIYTNKREKWKRIRTFFTEEMPRTMYESRPELLASFIIFVVSLAIGIISTVGNPDFPRAILGDYYVDMTLRNIEKGVPMDVYNSDNEASMFVAIGYNNVWVDIITFVMGLFTAMGTGLIIFINGVMVGCFTTFFAQHSLLIESSLSIWMHGTLEMSAMVVVGAAGIILGNGWMFPGTYSRAHSFRMAAKRGLKILICILPITLTAAYIESYITRHDEILNVIRAAFILACAAFIVWYFIIYPWMKCGRGRQTKNDFSVEENKV